MRSVLITGAAICPRSVTSSISGSRDRHTDLHRLVNNAGIAVPGPLETLPIEDFERQVQVNLTSQVAVTQAMLPLVQKARGRIVFVTSIGGLMIEHALGARRPRTRYLVGADARGQALAKKLLPDRAVDWLVRRMTGT